jgi:hypothetical protein
VQPRESCFQTSVVLIDIPAQVGYQCVLDTCCDGIARRRYVVLVAILANELKQLLEVWHFNHTVAAEGFEPVFRELTFSYIG